MSAHTPGPWSIASGSRGLSVVARENGGPVSIANDIHTEADRRLIAAAPDLLAGAKEARALLTHAGCPVDWLDELIAKAEAS